MKIDVLQEAQETGTTTVAVEGDHPLVIVGVEAAVETAKSSPKKRCPEGKTKRFNG